MATNVTDTFNRADSPLGIVAGDWVSNHTADPRIVNNELTVSAATLGHATHMSSDTGIQTSELTLVTLGSASHKGSVLAGISNHAGVPGTPYDLLADTFPGFYKFSAYATEYRLERKNVLSASTPASVVSYASNSSGTGASSTMSFTMPTVQNNDVAYVAVSISNNTTPTGPAGWTFVSSHSSTAYLSQHIWKKTVLGSESGGSVSWSPGASYRWALSAIVTRNNGGESFIEPSSSSGASTIYTFDSVTPLINDALLVGFSSIRASATGAFTQGPPGGWTEVTDISMNASSSPTIGISGNYKQLTGGVGVPTGSFIGSTSISHNYETSIMLVIAPQSGGGTLLTQLGGSYSTVPQNNDILKIEWDPATRVVKGYVNDMVNPKLTYDDSITNHSNANTRIGLFIEDSTTVDHWVGSWGNAPVSKTGSDDTLIGSSESTIKDPGIFKSDSAVLTSSESSSKTTFTPPTSIITRTDNFTASNGTWLGSTGTWVPKSATEPTITNNQLVTTSSPTSVLKESYSGTQTVKATVISNASTSTTRSGVIAGIDGPVNLDIGTSTIFTWNVSAGAWYRVTARAADYALELKTPYSTVFTIVGAVYSRIPVSGDIMEIRYNPATGTAEMWINNVQRTVYNAAPLTGDHSRVGVYINTGSIIDNFSVTWDTSTIDPSGWLFYEFTAPSTLTPLFTTEYRDGTQGIGEYPFNMTLTEEYGTSHPVLDRYYPVHSDTLLDSFGVRTAFRNSDAYLPNPTGWRNEIMAHLLDLGVRNIRDKIYANDLNSLGFTDTLQSNNIRACINLESTSTIYSSYTASVAGLASIMSWIRANPGYVRSVTGVAEANGIGAPTNWAAVTRNWQQAVWNAFTKVGGSYDLHNDGVEVLGPSLTPGDNAAYPIFPLATGAYKTIRDTTIEPYMDKSQLRRYTHMNEMPADGGTRTYPEYIDENIAAASIKGANIPIDYTEWGFWHKPSDHISTYDGYYTETAASVYIIRQMLDNFFRSDIDVSYIYDLVDEGPVGSSFYEVAGSDTTPYGLINSDNVKKDSFNRIKTLLALFKDIGPIYTPGPIDLKLTWTELASYGTSGTAADGGIRYGIVSKRNGTKMIIMWRLIRIWNTAGAAILGTPKIDVTIQSLGPTVNSKVVAVGAFPVAINLDSLDNIGTVTNLTPQF